MADAQKPMTFEECMKVAVEPLEQFCKDTISNRHPEYGLTRRIIRDAGNIVVNEFRLLFTEREKKIGELRELVMFTHCREGIGVSRQAKCGRCSNVCGWRTNNPYKPMCVLCFEAAVLAALADHPGGKEG